VDERPIREAAAAICVREAPTGEPEVLVVRRSAESRFLPGYISFPGGALEPEDEQRAARWFGDGRERHRAAAVRELVEEVGLALTADGFVAAGSLDVVDLAPPAAAVAGDLCHWVAPPEVPVRFDARYLVIDADGAPEPNADGREISAAWWISPRALLAGWDAGEHKLYWPTWFTVSQLAMCDLTQDIVKLRFETRDPTGEEERSMPRHVMEQVP